MNGKKALAYIVGGSILIVLAEVAPGFAVGTAGLIALWAVLSHANQLTTLSSWITAATK